MIDSQEYRIVVSPIGAIDTTLSGVISSEVLRIFGFRTNGACRKVNAVQIRDLWVAEVHRNQNFVGMVSIRENIIDAHALEDHLGHQRIVD